jgi:hypothetical protein
LQRRPGHGRVRTRELDQRGRARGVVVRTASLAVVVAMGGDHDCPGRVASRDGDDVLELDAAAARDAGPEAVRLRLEPVEGKLFRDPLGGAEAAGGSRRSIRVVPSELPCELLGRRPVERGRQRRRGQRLRPADGEGCEKQRQGDEQPRPTHQAGVDRPLDRAAAWARVRRARSSWRRHGRNQCRERSGGLDSASRL